MYHHKKQTSFLSAWVLFVAESSLVQFAFPALTLGLLFPMPQAAISTSHTGPDGCFFWVLLHSWALFPTTLGNIGPAAGPFQHSSCTSNPAALPLPGGLNVHKTGLGLTDRALAHRAEEELKLLSFLIQSLCNLSFGEISWSFLCGFSFHPHLLLDKRDSSYLGTHSYVWFH